MKRKQLMQYCTVPKQGKSTLWCFPPFFSFSSAIVYVKAEMLAHLHYVWEAMDSVINSLTEYAH
jgi:hypothetical protein